MVKNVTSSSNLRSSTSAISLRPSQTGSERAAVKETPISAPSPTARDHAEEDESPNERAKIQTYIAALRTYIAESPDMTRYSYLKKCGVPNLPNNTHYTDEEQMEISTLLGQADRAMREKIWKGAEVAANTVEPPNLLAPLEPQLHFTQTGGSSASQADSMNYKRADCVSELRPNQIHLMGMDEEPLGTISQIFPKWVEHNSKRETLLHTGLQEDPRQRSLAELGRLVPKVSPNLESASISATARFIEDQNPNCGNKPPFLGDKKLSLYQNYMQALGKSEKEAQTQPRCIHPVLPATSEDVAGMNRQGKSLIAKTVEREPEVKIDAKGPEAYTKPFCDFLTENPTIWHTVQYFEMKLNAAGFKKLSERQTWNSTLEKGGKYYVTRNGSSMIAFTVGADYKSGNGVAMIAGHIDALTARLKPVSTKTTKAGYVQLGVAPYAGALNSTWWDRDLGIGGRVLVKNGTTGNIETKLVKLGWPIARIPTLAPHFGVGMTGSNNAETEAVPIIGLDYSAPSSNPIEFENLTLGGAGSFTATQPPRLVRAIAGELSIQDYSSIVNWELELYDIQPAQVGGLDKEFIFAGRIDDKLCSWAAIEALLSSAASNSSAEEDGIVKLVGVFDDEEIGSLLRQGARGNFLPSTIESIIESFGSSSANILSQTYANSFLISADVTHAVNPNFLSRYLENHAPRLNVGVVVSADSNGHMTTDSVSTALLTRVAEKSACELQLFMIRNDSRSGGTVGPMLSSAMGVRAIDAGIPQLSMHSIRATTGALDPGLGVKIFKGFFDHFEEIDKEFE